MIVKLPTEYHLEFLSLKGGCTGSSGSTLVKISNCWKSRTAAHLITTESLIVITSDIQSSILYIFKGNV